MIIPRHIIGSLLAAITIAWLTPDASAGLITVTATAGPGLPHVTDSNGTSVPSGNEVQLGYFDTGFNVATSGGDLTGLRNAWNPFGDAVEFREIFSQPGRFSDSVSADDSGFAGQQVYAFAFMTASNSSPDATWSNVTEYGIFTNNSASSWVFPSSGASDPFTQVSTDTVTTAHWGTIGGSSLGLAAVPEISTTWTCGIAFCVSLIFSRRRPRNS